MININKLKKLDKTLIVRKAIRILYEQSKKNIYPKEYIISVLDLCVEKVPLIKSLIPKIDDKQVLQDIELILRKEIGEEQYDWDFEKNDVKGLNKECNLSVYIDRVRSPYNIGSICRTSEALGIKNVYLHPLCPSLDNKRLIKTSMGCLDHLNVSVLDEKELIKLNKPMFALELNGVDIKDFKPEKDSIIIVGSEEFGVSSMLLEECEKSLGRVSIPLYGFKGSLNVSNAYAICSYYCVNFF